MDNPTFLNRDGPEYAASPWTSDSAWPKFRLTDPGGTLVRGRRVAAWTLRRLAELVEP